ncbi:hypothetical protein VOLCADRAFT_105773 [Volvox carteri f. nagariensis]|uniref:Uncharacterized protein n=1 Tax=Volvox carteri f. nagariensis TaxID=3068 RepID=D8U2Y0_VOLCA|nr:uncharacterized protein VOLCADRAFT_105773 [Volvox carteri f. nagariensis]EFJ45979.1 hypothetical protein VOLCADRAFT_105773 [Volvox carteri f. nagariensis]|eukprot:XP_002953057.1 hypothetical protein VOLCADRAFT_105773 [Volvox carteri f. nagariensis]
MFGGYQYTACYFVPDWLSCLWTQSTTLSRPDQRENAGQLAIDILLPRACPSVIMEERVGELSFSRTPAKPSPTPSPAMLTSSDDENTCDEQTFRPYSCGTVDGLCPGSYSPEASSSGCCSSGSSSPHSTSSPRFCSSCSEADDSAFVVGSIAADSWDRTSSLLAAGIGAEPVLRSPGVLFASSYTACGTESHQTGAQVSRRGHTSTPGFGSQGTIPISTGCGFGGPRLAGEVKNDAGSPARIAVDIDRLLASVVVQALWQDEYYAPGVPFPNEQAGYAPIIELIAALNNSAHANLENF